MYILSRPELKRQRGEPPQAAAGALLRREGPRVAFVSLFRVDAQQSARQYACRHGRCWNPRRSDRHRVSVQLLSRNRRPRSWGTARRPDLMRTAARPATLDCMQARTLVLVLLTIGVFRAVRAGADLVPPPACPGGEHNQYLRGDHCVKDGFILVDSHEPPGYATVPDPSAAREPAPKPVAPAAKPWGCAAVPVWGPGAMLGAFVLRLRRRSSHGSRGS